MNRKLWSMLLLGSAIALGACSQPTESKANVSSASKAHVVPRHKAPHPQSMPGMGGGGGDVTGQSVHINGGAVGTTGARWTNYPGQNGTWANMPGVSGWQQIQLSDGTWLTRNTATGATYAWEGSLNRQGTTSSPDWRQSTQLTQSDGTVLEQRADGRWQVGNVDDNGRFNPSGRIASASQLATRGAESTYVTTSDGRSYRLATRAQAEENERRLAAEPTNDAQAQRLGYASLDDWRAANGRTQAEPELTHEQEISRGQGTPLNDTEAQTLGYASLEDWQQANGVSSSALTHAQEIARGEGTPLNDVEAQTLGYASLDDWRQASGVQDQPTPDGAPADTLPFNSVTFNGQQVYIDDTGSGNLQVPGLGELTDLGNGVYRASNGTTYNVQGDQLTAMTTQQEQPEPQGPVGDLNPTGEDGQYTDDVGNPFTRIEGNNGTVYQDANGYNFNSDGTPAADPLGDDEP